MENKVSERKRVKVEVPSLGKTLELRKPTLGEYGAYEEALENAKNGKGSLHKAMIDFAVSLGVPQEDVGKLDSDEYSEILSFAMASKKN